MACFFFRFLAASPRLFVAKEKRTRDSAVPGNLPNPGYPAGRRERHCRLSTRRARRTDRARGPSQGRPDDGATRNGAAVPLRASADPRAAEGEGRRRLAVAARQLRLVG